MNNRSIHSIIPPPQPHFVGDGFRVHNFFPSNVQGGMIKTDPFLLLDYGSPHYFEPSHHQRGVDVHPHRGFETVTFAFKGSVAHKDSSGGGGIIGEGDIQWMTAGSGVLHEEFHTEEFAKTGGEFHMAQLWVNLPAKDKMTKPKYQAIKNESIPRYESADCQVEIVAGSHRGIKGIASTFTPIDMLLITLNKGAIFEHACPSSYTAIAVNIKGNAIMGNQAFPEHHCAIFANDGEALQIEAREDSRFLLLAGEPIRESIVAAGPFVMNTREEIMQAFEDYSTGAFGAL
ncbi:MAG: pirin family protein [Bacteroidota bacterium]